jgi:[ribosomal protein S5]-alanine N-acetyltransferase
MEIATKRLKMREMRGYDLDALYALYSNGQYQRYEEDILTLEQTRTRLENLMANAQEEPRRAYRFCITLPPDDTLIGMVSLVQTLPAIREWEAGWGIHPQYSGLGFATEAAREVLSLAFQWFDAHRMVAYCHVDNVASQRVAEKLGMQREGRTRETVLIHGDWNDQYLYSVLRHEFRINVL